MAIVIAFAAAPVAAQAPLVADLSRHLVAITTGFSGTDVLLFGAVEGDGDVVVVVRGPPQRETLRRKDRIAGIWVNRGAAVVVGVPSFYQVAASKPLDQIAGPVVFERHQIGADHLDFTVVVDDKHGTQDSYRQALVRLKQDQGLFGTQVAPVTFLGSRLFRTEMHFPANVPTGTYSVEVYMVTHGTVVGAQTTPLIISKVGVGAEVFEFAHTRSALYGLAAVALAALAGWLAAVAFRRG